MSKIYDNIRVVEHYVFKHKDDFIFLDVNTLDVCILNELENKVIKTMDKSCRDYELNKLITTFGEKAVSEKTDELLKNGVLKLNREKKEVEPDERLRNQAALKIINSMVILISEDCNLACKYCYVKNGQYQGRSDLMDPDVGKKSIDFLIEKSENQKDLFVYFFGGEPLINFKVLEDIVIYALKEGEKNNKHFHFSLTTNGTLFNDEIIDFIKKHAITVVISIDGDETAQNRNRPLPGGGDSYSRITNNLKKLEQRKIRYSARATVSSLTISKLAENFEHLIVLGFKKIHFENALAPKGKISINDKNQIHEIKKQYSLISRKINKNIHSGQSFRMESIPLPVERIDTKRIISYPCEAGRKYIAVDVKGDLYLCHRLVGEETFFLGNVVEGTYHPKWGGIIQNEMSVDDKKTCRKCWARHICGGGCYAINYEFNKDISLTPPVYCQLKKHSIKLALTAFTCAP